MSNSKSKVEFGDFQTPALLASHVCRSLASRGVKPFSIVEPNCGKGSFVVACLENFPLTSKVLGIDINPQYVADLRRSLEKRPDTARAEILSGDFYDTDWIRIFDDLKEPFLIIGNPPWVTNAGIGALGGLNLPQKSNFQGHQGIDAITGKGNFDISEWMLIRESEWLNGRTGTLAMLCKTAVARKALYHAWKHSMQVSRSDIYLIDANKYFGVTVSACLLVCDFVPNQRSKECSVHASLDDEPNCTFGFRDGRLVVDISAYERWSSLRGSSEPYKWRSGIKHDCAAVMELQRIGKAYRNNQGEILELEGRYLYPMLKGSQLGNGSVTKPDQWMIVTQQFIGEDTSSIRENAPKTWEYLQRHLKRFNHRASSIYRGKPPFSVFGVGDYSFAPWKVATSALYKKLEFYVLGPVENKPIVLDDTCYLIPCQSQDEAALVCELLNSIPAREFYNSLIFWDAKRPVTAEILRQLDLHKVAREIGVEDRLRRHEPADLQSLFTSPGSHLASS
jgi:hypothetical protein